MANQFGFQMSEEFLRGYAEYLKQLREKNPGKTYTVTLSVDLVPDGTGYEITKPPEITIDEVKDSKESEEAMPRPRRTRTPWAADQVIDGLREALAQQRTFEKENWPFEGGTMGENISYHLAGLYCWSPEYVLTLPQERMRERLREVWRSFALAGSIIKRYEEVAERVGQGKDRAPEATVWATSTDLKDTKHERKVYFVLIRDGDKEHNIALTVQPDQAVTADRYVAPDYSYTVHDGCDHEHDECVLDDPNWEENEYGPQPGEIYQEVREGYKAEGAKP